MITLRHCSNNDSEHGLASLADKSVSHVITDPPYDAHTHTKMARVAGYKGTAAGYSGEKRADGSTSGVRIDLDFAHIGETERLWCAEQFVRLSRGWILIFCATEDVGAWRDVLLAAGARYRGSHLWHKTRATPKLNGNGPAKGFENFVLAWAGKGDSKWNGGGRVGNYSYAPEDWVVLGQKPIKLISQLMLDFTLPEDTILDPFMGRGTTGMAAKALGRSFIGYEIGLRQFEIASAEIERTRELRQTEMFALHREVKPRAYGLPTPPKATPPEQIDMFPPTVEGSPEAFARVLDAEVASRDAFYATLQTRAVVCGYCGEAKEGEGFDCEACEGVLCETCAPDHNCGGRL